MNIDLAAAEIVRILEGPGGAVVRLEAIVEFMDGLLVAKTRAEFRALAAVARELLDD